MSWKPIESAPKDGTKILLWDPTGTREMESDFWQVNRIHGQHAKHKSAESAEVASFKPYLQFGWFYLGAWHMVDEQCGEACRAEPTHWQPLPDPPV